MGTCLSSQKISTPVASNSPVKLLLLGAGESGKSTIAKQIRILFLDGFTEEELLYYRDSIHQNLISFMHSLLIAAARWEIKFNKSLQSSVTKILKYDANELITASMGKKLIKLWNSDTIQEIWKRRSEIQIYESCQFFYSEIPRITSPSYLPTTQDILHSRAKTKNINEIHFLWEEKKFIIVDVGGQRDERKNWVFCFENINAIIFCVAINEFDMKLFEDEEVYRMDEARKLFEEVCFSEFFKDSAIILFFNKCDLFRHKIEVEKIDMSCYFKKYKGGLDYEKSIAYLKKSFETLANQSFKKMESEKGKGKKNKNNNNNNNSNERKIYIHLTTAVDTSLMKDVLLSVRKNLFDTILSQQQIF